MRKLLLLAALLINVKAYGQLADGSIAPDFTLTDYNGTEHNLYSYLDAEKTVFVEIFAAHCSGCWNYHQTDRLKNMYNMYGPNGTDEIMVLALEHDQWNHHEAFIGIGEPWNTQGNWLDGTPYPIFDVENPDRGVFSDYNVTFYPVIYKICPDKIVGQISTSETETQLYEKVENCLNVLSLDEKQNLGNIHINQLYKSLVIANHEKVSAINVMDLRGQTVKVIGSFSSRISIDDLSTGIYLFEIQTENGAVVKKLYLN